MSLPFATELSTALAAVRQAAVVCQSVQAAITPDVLEKKDKSPVTVADFASQAVVCKALGEAFPDDPVIGEEGSAELRAGEASFLQRIVDEVTKSGINATGEQICDWIDRGDSKEYSDRFWTLDPIDGTKGFLRGEQYAISLALIVNGQIEVAAVGCPNLSLDPAASDATGFLGYAVRGQGSHVESIAAPSDPVQVSVTNNTDCAAARFCESVESGHSSHGHSAQVAELLKITKEPVRLDSQAKYAVVGRGEADIYLRLPTRPGYREKIWDHAGGVLFVTEAGGRVTDVAGRDLEFQHGFELKENRGVIVTNGQLHDQVLSALKEVGVE